VQLDLEAKAKIVRDAPTAAPQTMTVAKDRASTRSGISRGFADLRQTLRYYDQIGLCGPHVEPTTGYRHYIEAAALVRAGPADASSAGGRERARRGCSRSERRDRASGRRRRAARGWRAAPAGRAAASPIDTVTDAEPPSSSGTLALSTRPRTFRHRRGALGSVSGRTTETSPP
jgi:hypothetical protein